VSFRAAVFQLNSTAHEEANLEQVETLLRARRRGKTGDD